MIRPIALLTRLSVINLFNGLKSKQSMNSNLCEDFYKTYGLDSLYYLETNPYALLLHKTDLLPICFNQIDNYVYSIGIKYNDTIRLGLIITIDALRVLSII